MCLLKRVTLLLLLLCNSLCFYAYGQKPVITPKPNPVLPLDGNGQYTIQPGDIGTYNSGTDSPVVVKIVPQSVDCDMRGAQTVQVRALSNGAAPGSASISAVGFHGNFITGVTYDPSGNLYVIEDEGYRIRKITPEGNVTVFTGTGLYGGLNGPRGTAMVGALHGIVADKNGNIYIADSELNTVRKITPDGTISAFAGTGFPGHADGPADRASFQNPEGLEIDADGNIYVADTGNGMIRKISVDGIVSTVVKATYPTHIAVGPDGYIYWTSRGDLSDGQDDTKKAIYRIKPGGQLEVYAGKSKVGTAPAPFDQAISSVAYDLKFGPNGNLFVVDYPNVTVISPTGAVKTVVEYNYVAVMTMDLCGNLVLSSRDIIKRVSMNGSISLIAGGGGAALEGTVPASVCQYADAIIPVTVQSKPTLPDIQNKTVSGCATLADYTLDLATTDNCPSATVTYTQSPAAGTPFTGAAPVLVSITATDNTGGTDTKTFTVTNTGAGAVTPTVNVTAVNNTVCEGEQASFHAEVTNGDAGTRYQWQVNGVNAGTNSPNFTSTRLQNNDMVNCVVTTGGGCGVPNPGNGVTVTVNPKPGITLRPSEQLLAGTSVNLNPVVTGNVVSYKWEPAEGLSDPNSQYPVASPDVTTPYKLTVTTDMGCTNDASVTVTVVHKVTIPNTFTPNADGYNDRWDIKYLDAYGNCTVNVYTRSGTLVYHSKGYQTAWNGTNSGKVLPTGVYYYTIDLGNGSAILSGNVSILK